MLLISWSTKHLFRFPKMSVTTLNIWTIQQVRKMMPKIVVLADGGLDDKLNYRWRFLADRSTQVDPRSRRSKYSNTFSMVFQMQLLCWLICSRLYSIQAPVTAHLLCTRWTDNVHVAKEFQLPKCVIREQNCTLSNICSAKLKWLASNSLLCGKQVAWAVQTGGIRSLADPHSKL